MYIQMKFTTCTDIESGGVIDDRKIVFVCNPNWKSGRYDAEGSGDTADGRLDCG